MTASCGRLLRPQSPIYLRHALTGLSAGTFELPKKISEFFWTFTCLAIGPPCLQIPVSSSQEIYKIQEHTPTAACCLIVPCATKFRPNSFWPVQSSQFGLLSHPMATFTDCMVPVPQSLHFCMFAVAAASGPRPLLPPTCPPAVQRRGPASGLFRPWHTIFRLLPPGTPSPPGLFECSCHGPCLGPSPRADTPTMAQGQAALA